VRNFFISYAGQNKPDVEQLVEQLRVLGCDTWHDSSLRGGQDWWICTASDPSLTRTVKPEAANQADTCDVIAGRR
jgi:hypothetical protein